jgi:serine/threonine-protein kinase RsbW
MQDDGDFCDVPGNGRTLTVELASDATAVRFALEQIMTHAPVTQLSPDLGARLQLVLAEVLNNVVEHACVLNCGRIRVTVSVGSDGIDCCICDSGCPMPGEKLPVGALPDWSGGAPPEGGFGWFLIRQLTSGLHYRRQGTCNELRFQMALV